MKQEICCDLGYKGEKVVERYIAQQLGPPTTTLLHDS